MKRTTCLSLIIYIILATTSLHAQDIQIQQQHPVSGEFVFIGTIQEVYSLNTSTGLLSLAVNELPILSPLRFTDDGNNISYISTSGQKSYNINAQAISVIDSINDASNMYIPLDNEVSSKNTLPYLIIQNTIPAIYNIVDKDVNASSGTTLLTYPGDEILSNIPLPSNISRFRFERFDILEQNPVYDNWFLFRLGGGDPDNLLEISPNQFQENGLSLSYLWNSVTNTYISLDDFLSIDGDDTIILTASWSGNGNELALSVSNEEIYILNLDAQSGNIQIVEQTNTESNKLVEFWLGVTDYLIVSHQDIETYELSYSIGKIIDGIWHDKPFFRFLTLQTIGGSESDWYLRASQNEKYDISCIFDLALSSQLQTGQQAVVSSSTPLNLQSNPFDATIQITQVANGEIVDIIGVHACTDELRFWNVRTAAGDEGWLPEADTQQYFLQPYVANTCDYDIAAGDEAALIQAINAAKANPGAAVICLANSTYSFTSVAEWSQGPNALPNITDEITIIGNGATLTRDSSLSDARVARVTSGGTLTVENVIFDDWDTYDSGGVFYIEGTLSLTDSTLRNSSGEQGGALYSTAGAGH